MAKQVSKFPEASRAPGWKEQFMDGKIWEITQEDLITLGLKSMESLRVGLLRYSEVLGLTGISRMHQGNLYFQAVKGKKTQK